MAVAGTPTLDYIFHVHFKYTNLQYKIHKLPELTCVQNFQSSENQRSMISVFDWCSLGSGLLQDVRRLLGVQGPAGDAGCGMAGGSWCYLCDLYKETW